jgi:hypothetical protein
MACFPRVLSHINSTIAGKQLMMCAWSDEYASVSKCIIPWKTSSAVFSRGGDPGDETPNKSLVLNKNIAAWQPRER